jgi:hypothetical protein
MEYVLEDGANLKEAVKRWGEEAVFAQFQAGFKVAGGQYIRSVMEDEVAKACPEKDLDNLANLTDKEQTQIVNSALETAKAKIKEWKPGTKAPATKGSKASQVSKLIASAKPEEQANLLKMIQEQIAKQQAGN